MGSAETLPLFVGRLELGAFDGALTTRADWTSGISPDAGATAGSSPICARYRRVSAGNGRPRRR
jgi:hypothetical protein